jgi:hypothetical protein
MSEQRTDVLETIVNALNATQSRVVGSRHRRARGGQGAQSAAKDAATAGAIMTKPKSKKKHRRARGSGSVYQHRTMWWISYIAPSGERQRESSGSSLKGVAEKLLLKRTGAAVHNLPVVKYAERLSFRTAAQAVIEDFTANNRKSLAVLRRRITKHLMPVFGGMRLASITAAHVTAFVAKRQTDVIVVRKAHVVTLEDGTKNVPAVTKPVSGAEINRELATLKRIFSLAIDNGLIAMRPKIKMLCEAPARSWLLRAGSARGRAGASAG